MNVSYAAREDRLLLRVSTSEDEEFRIWLTRGYTSLLLGVLNKEMDNRGGAPAVAGNQETTKMIKNGALEKKYEEKPASDYPLGEEGVLAFRINTKSLENGVLALELLPEKGRGLTLNMYKSLLYMFHKILTQGITQAKWGLQTEAAGSTRVH